MVISQIELYSLRKTKLGEQEAKTLVGFIEEEIENKLDKKTEALATKEYVKAELANTKVDIIIWLVGIAIALGGLIIATAKFIH